MNRWVTRACITAVGSLGLLAATPAYAADDGAVADANALTATILGENHDTGIVVATNDGTGQTKTGTPNPDLTVLPDQMIASIGVLAQDAAAGADRTSEACAGVAGLGGSVVAVGESGCLEPGASIAVDLADLDLSSLLEGEVVTGSGSIETLLGALLPAQLDTVVAALQSAVDTLETQLGDTDLYLDAGAVQAVCTSAPATAEGTTYLTNAGVRLVIQDVGEQELVGFAPEPAPNTNAVANLDRLTAMLLTELEDSFHASLDTISDPLINAVLDPMQDLVVADALTQVEPALQDLDQVGLVSVVLNRQVTTADSIDVTGISLELMQAAADFGAPAPLLSLDVANVGCGPMERAATGDDDTSGGGTSTPPVTDTQGTPVPTVVNAGVDTMDEVGDSRVELVLALAGLLALGAAVRRIAQD